LERIFNLVGADLQQWFHEMPKTMVPEIVSPRKAKIIMYGSPDKKNINEHFSTTQCLACGEPTGQGLLPFCPYANLLPVVQGYATTVPSRVAKPWPIFALEYEGESSVS
jgi:hypothetical protein